MMTMIPALERDYQNGTTWDHTINLGGKFPSSLAVSSLEFCVLYKINNESM